MKTTTLMVGAALLAGAAFADKVTLKSGSFLTGEAGLIQEGKLLFKSDDLGDLKIDIASIKSVDPPKIVPSIVIVITLSDMEVVFVIST